MFPLTQDWRLFDLATNTWGATRTHVGFLALHPDPAKVYHQGYVYMAFGRYDADYAVVDNTFWRVPEAGGAPENLGPRRFR